MLNHARRAQVTGGAKTIALLLGWFLSAAVVSAQEPAASLGALVGRVQIGQLIEAIIDGYVETASSFNRHRSARAQVKLICVFETGFGKSPTPHSAFAHQLDVRSFTSLR